MLPAIAARAGDQLGVRITADQVAYIAEHKLAPLGLVPFPDGRVAALARRDALLGLKFRVGIVSERAVNRVARVFQGLFLGPIVIAAVAALSACDVWLATTRGISAGLRAVIQSPSLVLGLFSLTILSLVFHECGHAAACRYGGARPGRIGIGIYLVWPVFYTDVTDSYRLSKRGRLRTDLGGVYFNALVALAAAGAYLATGYAPLLVVVASQQLLILDQFLPWVRLDGYHIVSDLIGVSDLFARIKPVIASLVPRRSDRRVTELKPWARAAVTAWVLVTVAMLLAIVVVVLLNAPGYIRSGWQSLVYQFDVVRSGVGAGSVVTVLTGLIDCLMLLLPLTGIGLTYLLLCRNAGVWVAAREKLPTSDATIDHSAGHGIPPRFVHMSSPPPSSVGAVDGRSTIDPPPATTPAPRRLHARRR
jgi:putative peptide zinc metalloprotease protein